MSPGLSPGGPEVRLGPGRGSRLSDSQRRKLERAAKATTDPADRARALVERARAGELVRGKLDLLAGLGDAGARLAVEGLGGPPPPPIDPWALLDDDPAWAAPACEPWGGALQAVTTLAAARALLPVYEAAHPRDGRVRNTIFAAEDCIAAPTPARAGAALAARAASAACGRGDWSCDPDCCWHPETGVVVAAYAAASRAIALSGVADGDADLGPSDVERGVRFSAMRGAEVAPVDLERVERALRAAAGGWLESTAADAAAWPADVVELPAGQSGGRVLPDNGATLPAYALDLTRGILAALGVSPPRVRVRLVRRPSRAVALLARATGPARGTRLTGGKLELEPGTRVKLVAHQADAERLPGVLALVHGGPWAWIREPARSLALEG